MGSRNEISFTSTGRNRRRRKQQAHITRNTSEATYSSSNMFVNGSNISVNGGSISVNGGSISVNGMNDVNFDGMFHSAIFSGCIFRGGGINITTSSGRSTICIGDMDAFTTHSSYNKRSFSTVFSGCIFDNMCFGSRHVDNSRARTYRTRCFNNRSSTAARPRNSSSSSSVCISEMASCSTAIVPACTSTDNWHITSSNHPSEKSNAKQSEGDSVTYLYSVDKSAESRLVEEVTLGDGYEVAHLEKNNQSADTRSNISDQASASRKRKKSSPTSNSKKQNSSTARCTLCSTDFSSLEDKNENMYSVNCGHVFCHPCIRNMGSKRHCTICNTSIISFCELFL